MSIVTLDPEVRKKLEHTLNAKIPGPNDEAFEGFIESLRLAHPELHRELLQGVKVSAKMPVEEAVRRAAWRRNLRETLNRWFYQKRWPDDLVLDKKRVIFAGLGVLMLLLPVAFFLSGGLTGSPREAVAATPQPAEEVIATSETAQPFVNIEATVLERERLKGEATREPVETQATALSNDARTPIPPERLPQTTSSSPSFTPFPAIVPPQPTLTQIPSSFSSQSSAPALPTQLTVATSPPKPESITVWRDGPAGTMPSSDSLLGAPPSSLSSSAVGTQTSTVFVNQTEQLPTTAYTNEVSPEATLPINVMASGSQRQEPDKGGSTQKNVSSQQAQRPNLTIYTQSSVEPSPSASPTVFGRNQAGVVGETSSPSTDTATQNSESQPPVDATDSVQPVAPGPQLDAFLRPGDRVPATLVTGIVIAGDASVPVIAETKGDWCGSSSCPEVTWIGEATLSANNRVEIDFTQAVMGDELKDVSGLALSDDSVPGLPATLQNVSAAAAQDLLQSAIGGVSDYVKALTNQKRLVFQGDTILQEGQVLGIESFILGRVAELLSPPEAQTTAVRVASVPRGTPLTVLYGVGRN